MKLISWNIDSLNAALTSDSARAKLSQEVLQTLVAEDADIIAIQETKLSSKGPTKKHLEILEELFPGYENIWRMKARTEYMQLLASVDVHAPGKLRTNVQLPNFDEFFETFDVKEGDGMWRAPEDRVIIW